MPPLTLHGPYRECTGVRTGRGDLARYRANQVPDRRKPTLCKRDTATNSGPDDVLYPALRCPSQPTSADQSKGYGMHRKSVTAVSSLPGRPYVTHPGTDDGRGRAYPTHTPLGRLMALRGKVVYKFAAEVGISPRRLTELLAGRAKIHPKHIPRICAALECTPTDLRD